MIHSHYILDSTILCIRISESSKRGSFEPTVIIVFGQSIGNLLSPIVPFMYYSSSKTGLAVGCSATWKSLSIYDAWHKSRIDGHTKISVSA